MWIFASKTSRAVKNFALTAVLILAALANSRAEAFAQSGSGNRAEFLPKINAAQRAEQDRQLRLLEEEKRRQLLAEDQRRAELERRPQVLAEQKRLAEAAKPAPRPGPPPPAQKIILRPSLKDPAGTAYYDLAIWSLEQGKGSLHIDSFTVDHNLAYLDVATVFLDVATASRVASGQTLTLRWNTSGLPVPKVAISGPGLGTKSVDFFGQMTVDLSGVPAPGSMPGVPAPPLTFTLTATGYGGPNNWYGGQQTATVQVFPIPSKPQIIFFKSTPAGVNGQPTTINAGQSVTLSWQILSAPSISNWVQINAEPWGPGYPPNVYFDKLPLSGSLVVTPNVSTSYHIQASDLSGSSVSPVVNVIVAPAPPPPQKGVKSFLIANGSTSNDTFSIWVVDFTTGVPIFQGDIGPGQQLTVTPVNGHNFEIVAVSSNRVNDWNQRFGNNLGFKDAHDWSTVGSTTELWGWYTPLLTGDSNGYTETGTIP